MKKTVKAIGTVALCALIAAGAFACGSRNENAATPAPQQSGQPVQTGAPGNRVKTTPDPSADQGNVHSLEDYDYNFVRIAYSESANSMEPYAVTSVAELENALENVEFSTSARSAVGKNELLKLYDEEFFKSSYILVFNVTFSSGSVVPKIKSVSVDNGVVNVTTEGRMEGDVGTSDMASHMCLLALSSEEYPAAGGFSVTGAGTAWGGDKERA